MRRLAWILCTLLLSVVLTGCNMLGLDVETQLRPPRPLGEQREIQQALEDFLAADKGAGNYILKYPKQGKYRSAFLVEDVDGDGVEEALAFYSRGAESDKLRLNLLKRKGDAWQSVSDIEGYGTEIDRVVFADLYGDGRRVLMVGWNQFSSRSRQLLIYQIDQDHLIGRYVGMYTDLYVGDVTASGRDEMLLLNIAAGQNQVSAVLMGMEDSALTELGRASLDGYIQQFGTVQLGRLADAVTGVYIDCFKTANTMMTELIYWDGRQLVAPLYNTAENVSRQTVRETTIPAIDVDRDGAVEWPQCARLPGYATSPAGEAMWRTDWYSYQYSTNQPVWEFASVVNLTDNYYLKIDETWFNEHITASYQAATHTLTLMTSAGQPFLAVRATYADQPSNGALGDDGHKYEPLEIVDENVQYSVWYDTEGQFSLNLEKVGYMFTRLSR